MLQQMSSEVDLPEVHGIASGLLCMGASDSQDEWIEQVLGPRETQDLLTQEAEALLRVMWEELRAWLADPQLGFQPQLPDDSVDLPQRARALASWCQGFLFGVGLADRFPTAEMPEDVREILQDLEKIASLDPAEEETDQAAETHYQELVEFVRMGVLLIQEEMVPIEPLHPQRFH